MVNRLSIIIVTWNTSQITCRAINSIYKHLKDLSFEIIVVDNNSSDNTVNQITLLQQKYSNLLLIKNKKNLGFSKANNIGVKKAGGQYLFFLNSDTLLIDNSISQAICYLKQNNTKVGIVAPQLLNANKTPQASVFPPQTILNAVKQFCLNQPNQFTKYTPASSGPVNAVSGAALIISHQDFKKITGWNEKYFFYFEDLDLCRKIHQIHKQVYYYKQSKIIHLHGQSNHSTAQNQQWKKLIPGSLTYHGPIKHYLLTGILWLCQKIKKSP